MEGVKEWDEGQIAKYIDLFTFRQMHDQTWLPCSGYSSLKKKGKTVEAQAPDLLDDGRYKLAKKVYKNEVKLNPIHQSQLKVKNSTGEEVPLQVDHAVDGWGRTLLPKDSVKANDKMSTEDLQNVPTQHIRCTRMEQLLFNCTREPQRLHNQLRPAVVNFLDIPMSLCNSFYIPVDGLDSFPNLQSHVQPEYTFAT